MYSEILKKEIPATLKHFGLIPDKEWGDFPADLYYVSFDGVSHKPIEYKMGVGHRSIKENFCGVIDKNLVNKALHGRLVDKAEQKRIIEKYTEPKQINIDDVLHCLVSDSTALSMDFEEWCSEFGYEEDSRKAEKIYNACRKNGKVVSKVIDLEAAREAFMYY